MSITDQAKFHRFLKSIFKNLLPEKSQFNRICNNEGVIIRRIRLGLIHNQVNLDYTIIDSFPMHLCQKDCNCRAKLMSKHANKRFNLTKQLFFYGYKAHCEVSDSGIILTYAITKASIHDIKVTKTLLNKYPNHIVLMDKGYISSNLKHELQLKDFNLEIPNHSDIESQLKFEKEIIKHRLRVKTTFS